MLSGRGLCDELKYSSQRSPTESNVSECDHESSIIRWPCHTGGVGGGCCCPLVNKKMV